MRTLKELIAAAVELNCRDFVVTPEEASLLKLEAPQAYWSFSPVRRDPTFLGCLLVAQDATDAIRAHEQEMRRG